MCAALIASNFYFHVEVRSASSFEGTIKERQHLNVHRDLYFEVALYDGTRKLQGTDWCVRVHVVCACACARVLVPARSMCVYVYMCSCCVRACVRVCMRVHACACVLTFGTEQVVKVGDTFKFTDILDDTVLKGSCSVLGHTFPISGNCYVAVVVVVFVVLLVMLAVAYCCCCY